MLLQSAPQNILRTSQDYNYKFAMFGAFISPNVPAYNKETDPSRKSLLRTANNEANNNVNSKHAFDVKHVREGDEEWLHVSTSRRVQRG